MSSVNSKLVIISGPTGAGKTVIVKALLESRSDLVFVDGTTTRPRTNRVAGDRALRFVSEEEFSKLETDGEFLETATVHGFQYGTSKKAVADVIAQGKIPLLTIDVNGHAVIRALRQYSVCSVFLVADDMPTLEQRIRLRQPDIPQERLVRRMETAKQEMARSGEYDIVVANRQGKLEEAVSAVSSWIDSCSASR